MSSLCPTKNDVAFKITIGSNGDFKSYVNFGEHDI